MFLELIVKNEGWRSKVWGRKGWQSGESSPPTHVARVQIPASTLHVV